MKLFPVLLSIIGLASVGCVNARDEYDGFRGRVLDAAPPIDAMIVSSIPDVTGEFFIAARPNLPDDRFLFFRIAFVFTPITENTGELDTNIVALDYTTFEEVGAPCIETDVPVGSSGIADIPLFGSLDGRANSVTDTTIMLDATIQAELRTADFVCGGLTGIGGSLSLAGSTFGAGRITGAELPAAIHRCEGQPAI